MTSCSLCLKKVAGGSAYHPQCSQNLFGTTVLPAFEVELSALHGLAAGKMAGKMSLSGAQEKVSLVLSSDKKKLHVSAVGGRYILKPETSRFPFIPQNEHLTMLLARLVDVETPPFGLIQLKDGSKAYVIKRFDRLDNGRKLQVEDFCQLAIKRIRDKYNGSAELCVRLLRKFASEPLIEIRKIYRQMLFSWWVENGDLHLKNFSLLTAPDGVRRLSPAYDLVCTKLVIPDDTLAMPMGGRDRKLTRRKWLDFAEYCGIPGPAAMRLIAKQIKALEPALRLVSASHLPMPRQVEYENYLRRNTSVLSGSS